jgi:hypothetical protein
VALAFLFCFQVTDGEIAFPAIAVVVFFCREWVYVFAVSILYPLAVRAGDA